jgi:hypothetical protein
LSWGDPNGEASLYGMTNKDPKSLVDLARSWNHPAEVKLTGSDWKNQGYDYTQRAYVLQTEANPKSLEMMLMASVNSPLVNPAFVLENWGLGNLRLELDGNPVSEGKDFRYGIEYDVEGKPRIIVWMKYSTDKPVKITLISKGIS